MRATIAASLLVACGGGLHDERVATGSRTTATSRNGDVVYNVNVDEGTVTAIPGGGGATTTLDVGGEPTRIARVDHLLVVTDRLNRQLVVLDPQAAPGNAEVARMNVGAEPVGVVASEDGKTVWVAVSMQDQVVEIDAATWTETRRFDVLHQPQWLALHPSERSLFVASPYERGIQRIDLRSGAVEDIALPVTTRLPPDPNASPIPFDLVVRVTGDPSITPDGSELGIPTLYVDNTTSVADPSNGDEIIPGSGYGSSGTLVVSRTNPAVVQIPLDGSGRPKGDGEPVFAGAISNEGDIVRSYPTSLTASPEGDLWYVTMEASDAVVVLPIGEDQGREEDKHGDTGSDERSFDTEATLAFTEDSEHEGQPDRTTRLHAGGFVTRPTAAFKVEGGPKSVSFTETHVAYVHGWLDRKLRSIETQDHKNDVEEQFVSDNGTVRVVADSVLPLSVQNGRRLFTSAVDEDMAGSGSGISCSTCHFDGRNDGLTWPLESGPRQTPSLAGEVGLTAPVTWSEGVQSVAHEAQITSKGRMGGEGLVTPDANDIGAYVDATRHIDNPDRGSTDALILEGKDLFERADVACASCHGGEIATDNLSHALFSSEAMQTPTLIGVRATAPYLHDGSAKTLRDVLELSRSGVMGDTSMLTDAQMDALEAYVRSL